MGTVATVTVGADTVSVYGLTTDPVTDATSWFNTRLGADATAWATASADNRARALVTAADWMDRALRSQLSGEKTSDTQPREWPRDGATCSGTAVPDGTTPDNVAYAEFWLAGQLILNSSLATGSGTGSNVKSVKAGSAAVSFFQPTIGAATDTRLPIVAMDYLRCFFDGAGTSLAAGLASGVDGSSAFGNCDFERSDGFS